MMISQGSIDLFKILKSQPKTHESTKQAHASKGGVVLTGTVCRCRLQHLVRQLAEHLESESGTARLEVGVGGGEVQLTLQRRDRVFQQQLGKRNIEL